VTLFLSLSLAGCTCNEDKRKAAERADKADRAFRKGFDANQRKDFDAAIAAYTEAIEYSPGSADARFNRGLVYSEMNRLDDAIADFTESISRDGLRADAFFARGRCYARKANPDDDPKAIVDFSETIRLNPAYAAAYHARGVSRGAVGELDAGIEDVKHSLDLDPNQESAWRDLVKLMGAKEEFERRKSGKP
jgi:tetratricopeptide (TPR) repeat protein